MGSRRTIICVVALVDMGSQGRGRGGFHSHSAAPAHRKMDPTGCNAPMSNCNVPRSDRDVSMSGLFARFGEHLEAAGYIARGGQIIDATIV